MRKKLSLVTSNDAERAISKIDLMVLGLVLEKPMHGYEINQTINSEEMQSWLDISRTSVYYALGRLKKQGLITEVVEKQYNKPDRSVYRITEAGRELFFDSLALTLAEQEKVFLDYNVGLFFINKFAKEKALEVLEKRKRFLADWRTVLNKQLKFAEDGESGPATLRAVIDHTRNFAEHEVSWLNSFIEEVKGNGQKASQSSVLSLGGSLEDTQLADVIRIIASGERTGTLTLKQGLDEVTITFEKGAVRYVTDSFGTTATASTDSAQGTQFPQTVLEAFNWLEGDFAFEPDVVVTEGGVAMSCESCELILAGARAVSDWNRIRKVVPSSKTVYSLSERRKRPLTKVTLTDEENTILSQVNGLRDIERLAEITSISIFEISRILYTYVICGLVTPTSNDKAEIFNLLKLLIESLFERLTAIKAEKIAEQVETDLNRLAAKKKMPFVLQDFKLNDSTVVPQELKELADQSSEFYTAAVNVIRSNLGSRFTDYVIESIVGQLTPEAFEIYSRYGFNLPHKK